jgi:hypothetical protein
VKKSILFIISFIFCLAIFIPFYIGIFEIDKEISKVEKRKLSQIPKMPKTITEVKIFPKLFDTYYSDHFGLRDWFTKYYKVVKYSLGDSPSEDVTIGKNGWLFLGSMKKGYNKFRDPIGDFRNVNLYSQKALKEFAKYMTGLKSWLNDRGIEYIFVIAPNKHTVYFDELPDYISKVNEYSATDQLIGYLKQYTDVPVIDLRSKLINEKDKYQLYYKTDTHWNHYAANIAQYEIMLEIEKLFPKQIQPEMIDLKDGVRDGGDLANFMGVHIFKELNPQPIFEQTCTPKKYVHDKKGHPKYTMICEDQKLNAIIFRDSFFSALQPYFSRKFKRSTYIWEKLNYSSLIKYIKLEKPNIIIEEWVERSLPYVPKVINEFNSSLNKKIFNSSDKLIFSNDWKKLKFYQLINDKNNFVNLIAIGNDPKITFPPLPFKSNHKYILHIAITSSVKSTLQIFYSDSGKSGYPFSAQNLVQIGINKGDNDVYILLNYPNLGKYLRLDPITRMGEVTIKTLDIKEVQY